MIKKARDWLLGAIVLLIALRALIWIIEPAISFWLPWFIGTATVLVIVSVWHRRRRWW